MMKTERSAGFSPRLQILQYGQGPCPRVYGTPNYRCGSRVTKRHPLTSCRLYVYTSLSLESMDSRTTQRSQRCACLLPMLIIVGCDSPLRIDTAKKTPFAAYLFHIQSLGLAGLCFLAVLSLSRVLELSFHGYLDPPEACRPLEWRGVEV